MSGRTIRANGIDIAYEETAGSDDRPCVVALHGGLSDRRAMLGLLAPLAGTHRVIAPDLRGHGGTALPDGEWGYEEMGQDLLGFLDALKLDRPVVVGYSDGANAALAAAVARPRFARGLVLVAPVNRRSAHYETAAVGMLGQPFDAPLDVARFERERPEIAAMAHASQGARWRSLMPHLARVWARVPGYGKAELGRVAMPVLYLFGEEDVVPKAEREELRRETPGSELRVVPGDHFWPEQRPDEFARFVASFVERVERSG